MVLENDDDDNDEFFCGMFDRRKAFSLISSRGHCQRSLPCRISDTQGAGFKPPQNPTLGFADRSCAVVTTTTPLRHRFFIGKITEGDDISKS